MAMKKGEKKSIWTLYTEMFLQDASFDFFSQYISQCWIQIFFSDPI